MAAKSEGILLVREVERVHHGREIAMPRSLLVVCREQGKRPAHIVMSRVTARKFIRVLEAALKP